MGQWYEIGLQTGKKITEAVDAFIKAEHKSNKPGDNFDPKARKTLSDGTTIYKWYMKWEPSWYQDEKRFMAVLDTYNDNFIEALDDDNDADDYAWKLIAVGDEGGSDERGNTAGFDTFEDLYNAAAVTFPEDFDEPGQKTKKNLYPLVTHYSFDAEVPVRLFDTEEEAVAELRHQFEEEKRIELEENERTEGKDIFFKISDDGTYASITHVIGGNEPDDITEWTIGDLKN